MNETNAAAVNPAEVVEPKITHQDVAFHYKTDKELGIKRPTVKLAIPVLTVAGLIDILMKADPKEIDLVMEAVNAVIIAEAREQANNRTDINQENLDTAKLAWSAIANLPKAERRGSSIPTEIWEAFSKDYCDIMPGLTGKKEQNVQNAAKLFVAKLNPAKGSKEIIQALKPQLALWFEKTTQQEELGVVYEYLNNKMEAMLKAEDPATLLANL
jgi:hypothetical protein